MQRGVSRIGRKTDKQSRFNKILDRYWLNIGDRTTDKVEIIDKHLANLLVLSFNKNIDQKGAGNYSQ
ncbi:hypothetical protein [Calothrix sp. PCC 7507]|uniref:hypothetical protein n=1 Tax=Calothrix sp. PCC 7507 TaxID=99598 RepID=UPI0002FD84D6|nr:hypothetical protein [Calothrix sp. PCC 7507]